MFDSKEISSSLEFNKKSFLSEVKRSISDENV